MQTLISRIAIIAFVFAVLSGCGKTDMKVDADKKADQKQQTKEQPKKDSAKQTPAFAPQSVDDLMSKNITNYLLNDFLKKDIDAIPSQDRKFQFFKIDLNGDNKEEYIVRLLGSYFCGSGGCTFLVLDREANLITKFTVTDAPLYVSSDKENNWSVLYLMSGGKLRKIVHNKKSYPSNPSVIDATDYIPGEKEIAVFDDVKSPAKTYTY
jgi:predicted small lipoprotein YifL